ncbi:hypothetical protein DPMN_013646 [Dreissena polymorpha]|uniref:Glycosyltransferase family 92 protein n=1 Tax=Dreissena polymorpha TaxID=45954 RepID=A0A9D4NA77_DREPO|nr:hypothetical protein DPMN_013646 [Dreissena polymorpha]
MIPREFEDASSAYVQMWKDEVITVVDCQERMAGYQYAMFLDVDEFLLPVNMPLRNSWLRYLVSSKRKYGCFRHRMAPLCLGVYWVSFKSVNSSNL